MRCVNSLDGLYLQIGNSNTYYSANLPYCQLSRPLKVCLLSRKNLVRDCETRTSRDGDFSCKYKQSSNWNFSFLVSPPQYLLGCRGSYLYKHYFEHQVRIEQFSVTSQVTSLPLPFVRIYIYIEGMIQLSTFFHYPTPKHDSLVETLNYSE